MSEAKKLNIDQFKVDPKKMSQKDVEEAIALLAKERLRKERIKTGEIKGTTYKKMSEMTPEEQAKQRARNARLLAKNSILVAKAKAAGIVVTEAEVDTYIKSKKA